MGLTSFLRLFARSFVSSFFIHSVFPSFLRSFVRSVHHKTFFAAHPGSSGKAPSKTSGPAKTSSSKEPSDKVSPATPVLTLTKIFIIFLISCKIALMCTIFVHTIPRSHRVLSSATEQCPSWTTSRSAARRCRSSRRHRRRSFSQTRSLWPSSLSRSLRRSPRSASSASPEPRTMPTP